MWYLEYFTKPLERIWAQEECHHWLHSEQQIQELFSGLDEDRFFSQGQVCDVVLVFLWLNLSKFSLDPCNFLAVLRVRSVKFVPLFDLVLLGDARQLEVFTLTGILLLGVLRQDILQSKLLISQSDDSVNAKSNQGMLLLLRSCCVVLLCWLIPVRWMICLL